MGNIVGMAYVVARPGGRFEIRESVHTPNGPRARSLANFAQLSDEVLATARRRATRPFDADAVRASARRRGVPVGHGRRNDMRHFVESSRRMAASLETRPPDTAAAGRRDPGEALIDLLNFAEQIAPFTPRRPLEGLAFPPLGQVRQQTRERQAEPT